MKSQLATFSGIATLLCACTARLPADVELVSMRAVLPGLQPAALAEKAPPRLLQVAFASRVNLVRFVTVNGYSLGAEADFCDGPEAPQPLVASGLSWQGRPLVPGGPEPVRRDGDESLLDYTFFLDAEKATARPADICFNIAGGNADRGYRSNTVTIPQVEIMGRLLLT